jgi:hypothetical protein
MVLGSCIGGGRTIRPMMSFGMGAPRNRHDWDSAEMDGGNNDYSYSLLDSKRSIE